MGTSPKNIFLPDVNIWHCLEVIWALFVEKNKNITKLYLTFGVTTIGKKNLPVQQIIIYLFFHFWL